MASLYTANQKEEVSKVSVYDYMYSKLRPPVPYGDEFYVHTNKKRGQITDRSDPGGILISRDGYFNYTSKNWALDSFSGPQAVYALMDYYSEMGYGYYSPNNTEDFAKILSEVASDLGISQDPNSKAPAHAHKPAYVPPTMLERYNKAVVTEHEKAEPVTIPPRATVGTNGYSPDSTIIKYMAERGISSNITKDLISAGVMYLTESNPYYEVEKDAKGNMVKTTDGKPQYKLDKDGNKIPQTYKDPNTGETRVKMQYNIVFASKDQSKENAFYERKPIAQRGMAFISPNSSSIGYFSFTGGMPNFEQVPAPEKTGKPMKAYICEGPVDAISLYALHQKMGVKEPAEYISISGVGKELPIQRAICQGYDCVLAFDNDEKGKQAMDPRRRTAFIDVSTGKECALPNQTPPPIVFDYAKYRNSALIHVESKDWNDVLLAATKGQGCQMKMKGEVQFVNPVNVMNSLAPCYSPNPKAWCMWKDAPKGFKANPAPQIKPQNPTAGGDHQKSILEKADVEKEVPKETVTPKQELKQEPVKVVEAKVAEPAVSKDDNWFSTIAEGSHGDCSWKLYEDGVLQISPDKGDKSALANTNGELPPWFEHSAKIEKVFVDKGVSANIDASCLFAYLPNCKEMDVSGLDTSKTQNMDAMFATAHSMTSLNLGNMDTSNVTKVNSMFADCPALESVKGVLDMPKAQDTKDMFEGCNALKNKDFVITRETAPNVKTFNAREYRAEKEQPKHEMSQQKQKAGDSPEP